MSQPLDQLHLAFPFAIANGLPRTVNLTGYIPQLIEQILFTAPGERVNRPNFGCGISQLVFQPLEEDAAVSLQQMLQAQLQQYITDYAEIVSLSVSSQSTEMLVTVTFRDRTDGTVDRVVYRRLPTGALP